jgi:hypothetical protein
LINGDKLKFPLLDFLEKLFIYKIESNLHSAISTFLARCLIGRVSIAERYLIKASA